MGSVALQPDAQEAEHVTQAARNPGAAPRPLEHVTYAYAPSASSPTPSTSLSQVSYGGGSSLPASPGAQRMLQAYRAKHIIQQVVEKLRSPKKEDRITGASQLEKLSSEHHEIQNLFREAGAIRYLVAMLGLTLQEAEMAVRALINIVCNNPANKDAVRTEGGIPPLLTLTHLKHDIPVTRWAVWATGAIASNTPTNQDAIRAHGGIPPLVKLLGRETNDMMASEAAIALVNLAFNNKDNQDAIREAGGVQAMVQLLKDGRSKEATVQTLWTLNCLVVDNIANKEAIRDVAGLPRIVDLLRVQ
mmetsp:Transcript_20293/g.56263  ORF Transcript_20293/g.56263 Transcript_20293/m.56263 type:complete len:303 (-) Transcript_20293:114-1022(-)